MSLRGTPQGRRLFAGCVAAGVGTGLASALGAAYVFRQDAPFRPCGPANQELCRRLDIAGFELHSSLNAALVVGPIVGFLAFLVIVVVVLYTSESPHRNS